LSAISTALLLDELLREETLAPAAFLISAGAFILFFLKLQSKREIAVFLFVFR